MAANTLSVGKQKAGEEYLEALRSLGCEPDALFWAKDDVTGHDVLVLVTILFDTVGPLSLSELLFKAYDRSATPQEIDPFILRLHSPKHAALQELARLIGRTASSPLYVHKVGEKPSREGVRVEALSMGNDVTVYADWIYKFDLSKHVTSVDARRRWRRFQERVDRLAA